MRTVARYNRRIGTTLHRVVHRIFTIYLFGCVAYLLFRVLFRVRVVGAERVGQAGPGAIFAARHFHEWDPFVSGLALFWARAFAQPRFTPIIVAGKFWLRTRLWRAISYHFGILGIVRGEGPRQGAMRRSAELLGGRHPMPILLFPTGPVGLSPSYEVKPGVGHLAASQPEVPVVPIAVMGVQGLRVRSLLRLERPRVTIVVGAPFRAAEIEGDDEHRIAAVADRIAASWDEAERTYAPRR